MAWRTGLNGFSEYESPIIGVLEKLRIDLIPMPVKSVESVVFHPVSQWVTSDSGFNGLHVKSKFLAVTNDMPIQKSRITEHLTSGGFEACLR